MAINERVYGGFRRTTGDETGRQLAILLPTDYRVLHLASAADHATDWGVANPTDPTFYVHSATTPATDYLSLAHNGNNGVLTLSGGGLSVSSSGVHIGDDANTNLTVGLTMNQGANDDYAFALKSSDIATGLVDGTITGLALETDDYYTISKRHATNGGVTTQVLALDAALATPSLDYVVGGTATAVKTTSGRALKEIVFYEHDGSNGRANITANGNIFGIRAYVGGSVITEFMVDEDGDLFAANATVDTFDTYDDADLVRALEITRAPAAIIKSEWDEHIKYNEESVIASGVLGGTLAEGGLVNVTQLQRLHNGAIWQLWTDVLDVAKALPEAAQEKLPARIKDRFLALNAG